MLPLLCYIAHGLYLVRCDLFHINTTSPCFCAMTFSKRMCSLFCAWYESPFHCYTVLCESVPYFIVLHSMAPCPCDIIFHVVTVSRFIIFHAVLHHSCVIAIHTVMTGLYLIAFCVVTCHPCFIVHCMVMHCALLSLSSFCFFLSMLTDPPTKRTKHTGGKTPEEVISPDNNDTPEDSDDDALDENSADKQTDDTSYHSSDAGNVLGSEGSVDSNDDPGEEFDERELDAYGDLERINCHDDAET